MQQPLTVKLRIKARSRINAETGLGVKSIQSFTLLTLCCKTHGRHFT